MKRPPSQGEKEREREAKKGKIIKKEEEEASADAIDSIVRSWTRSRTYKTGLTGSYPCFGPRVDEQKTRWPRTWESEATLGGTRLLQRTFFSPSSSFVKRRDGSCALIARDGWPETAETFISAGGGRRLSKVFRLPHRWMTERFRLSIQGDRTHAKSSAKIGNPGRSRAGDPWKVTVSRQETKSLVVKRNVLLLVSPFLSLLLFFFLSLFTAGRKSRRLVFCILLLEFYM